MAYSLRKVDLLLGMIRSGADYQDVGEALTACRRALQLAEERVKAQNNLENQYDLVVTYNYLGDVLSATGDRDSDSHKTAQARRAWSEALGYLKKGQDALLNLSSLPEWNSRFQELLNTTQGKIPIIQQKVSSGNAG
jgi:hypothetical protein